MIRAIGLLVFVVAIVLSPLAAAQAPGGGVPVLSISQSDAAAGVNAIRARYGLGALTPDPNLHGMAQAQADAMAAADQLSHNVAGAFGNRMPAGYGAAAENIAAGTWSLADTLRLWEESQAHLANMLIRDLSYVGFGYAYSPRSQRYYLALILAAPR